MRFILYTILIAVFMLLRCDYSFAHDYYCSNAGNDNNNGTLQQPFKTLEKLSNLQLQDGDKIFLKGGDVFAGTLTIKSIKSTAAKPFIITSYGNGKPTIDAKNEMAVMMSECSFIQLSNIICKGSGRKEGNTKSGVFLDRCTNSNVKNIDVSGFQKSGVFVYCGSNNLVENVFAHDNGFCGVYISGEANKESCNNVIIRNCRAENNPGDPTEFNNHSGNGILAGFCKNVLIEYCTATNNGWDMPRIGNGPVGIWCYEADSVIIQHCISYKNKTSKGGEDGGGYDFDGGVTNSVIQYCLSYENQGSAFGIFQYADASEWHDNVIRYCISVNDGNTSAAHANAYVWNSSHDSTQFKDFLFYNNTLYNNKGSALAYSVESDHSNFEFLNNIFVATDSLIRGEESNDVYLANNWYSLQHGFNVKGNYDFKNWAVAKNKEQLNNKIIGKNINPAFKNATVSLTDANQLKTFKQFKLKTASVLLKAGIDIQKAFGINTGTIDFNMQPLNKQAIGACTN